MFIRVLACKIFPAPPPTPWGNPLNFGKYAKILGSRRENFTVLTTESWNFIEMYKRLPPFKFLHFHLRHIRGFPLRSSNSMPICTITVLRKIRKIASWNFAKMFVRVLICKILPHPPTTPSGNPLISVEYPKFLDCRSGNFIVLTAELWKLTGMYERLLTSKFSHQPLPHSGNTLNFRFYNNTV